MANTYTQLYVQFIFSVKGRKNLIKEKFRDELEKIMCGIVSNHKSKTYAIYCNPDHTHIFVGMHPTISVSKLIEQIKCGSSNWLNDEKYIINQPEHHKKQSFKDEYLSFLNKFDVDSYPKYLFEWYENI